jgi:hypothetical protein
MDNNSNSRTPPFRPDLPTAGWPVRNPDIMLPLMRRESQRQRLSGVVFITSPAGIIYFAEK